MLKGLQRVFLIMEILPISLSQKEAEIEFLRATDNVSAFIEECATFSKTLFATKDDAKEAYQTYCDYWGLDAENDKVFCSPTTQHTTY